MPFIAREMDHEPACGNPQSTLFVERSRSVKRKTLRFGMGFRVAIGNRRSEAAEMVIGPGDAEGDRCNRHRGSDQWLYVVSGTGIATVNGERYRLRERVLLLIEHGDKHEILNHGSDPLRTLNFYVPPAYTKGGETLPRGRR
jgi:mannose-6-phosphate isomerase-like protein (cupin superfamily)